MSVPLPSVTILIISSAPILGSTWWTSFIFNFLPLAVFAVPSGPWHTEHLSRYRSFGSFCAHAPAAPKRNRTTPLMILMASKTPHPSDREQVRAEIISRHDLLNIVGALQLRRQTADPGKIIVDRAG